jgi:predicted Zn-dependent peptidase
VFLRLVYGDHPYGHLAIGNESTLASVTLEAVQRAHREAYRPDRATLVVAGPMAHERLAAIARDAFEPWVRPESAPESLTGKAIRVPASELPPPAAPSSRLAIVPRENAAQSEIRIGHLSARRGTPDYAALLVMNAVMGGQFTSRINLKLREEKGYTYGARTGFDWRRGLAPFVLQASVHTGSTAEAIRDSLAELEAIRSSRPPSDSELALAKASLTRGYPRNFETAQQVARSVAQLVLFDLPDSYFEEFVPKVHAVRSGDVSDVARRYIDPDHCVTLVVGDHAAIGESLLTLGLGPPDVLPAAER